MVAMSMSATCSRLNNGRAASSLPAYGCFRRPSEIQARSRQGLKTRALENEEKIDSIVLNKKAPHTKEQALLTLEESEPVLEGKAENFFAYVGLAVAFGAGIFFFRGPTSAEEYFAGYLLEQSLSTDNLFVFILCFNFFQTPAEYQGKVLNVGIISAAVLRLLMILAGVELVENFRPLLLVFAAVLLFSSFKLLFVNEDDKEEKDLSQNAIVKLVNKLFTVTSDYRGDKLFVVEDGVRKATPLLVALAVIEISDIIFAVDSIPAVFGVTLDPFIIYTSNMFAIISLRALYGFVSTVISELRYLDKAVAIVLGFIGFKMIADQFGFEISTTASLAVVATTLGAGTGASLLLPAPAEANEDE